MTRAPWSPRPGARAQQDLASSVPTTSVAPSGVPATALTAAGTVSTRTS